MVTQNTRLVLLLSLRSVSISFFLMDYTPCLFMWRCPIVVLMELSGCFMMNLSYRPGYDFRKLCLMAFISLVLVRINIAAWYYLASSCLVAWASTFCSAAMFSSLCGVFYMGNSHMLLWWFLYPIRSFCPFFWNLIVCFSSVLVQLSSHRTPNDVSGGVFFVVKMWIFLALSDSPSIGNVAIFVYSMVLSSVSLASMVCLNLFLSILVDYLLAKCLLDPDSDIFKLVIKGATLGG